MYKLPTLEPKATSRCAGNVRSGAGSSGGRKLQEAAELGLVHIQKLAASHVSGLAAVAKGRHVGLLNLETLLTSNAGLILAMCRTLGLQICGCKTTFGPCIWGIQFAWSCGRDDIGLLNLKILLNVNAA